MYVRKPSVAVANDNDNIKEEEEDAEDNSKARKFMSEMSKKTSEVPTDFLNTIQEEQGAKKMKPFKSKYPFNR